MEQVPEFVQPVFPEITLEQTNSFDSKTSPIYYAKVLNASGEEIGTVDYQLYHKDKKIIIQSVEVKVSGNGYGKSIYRYLQDAYPDYELVSSDSMTHKTDEGQELSDAVRLWESLVKNGMAEKTEAGYRMKK